MANLTEFNLNTHGSLFLLILFIILAAGLSYFVYRKTVPPISNGLRFLLMAMRALVVVLVIFLFFEPILSLTRKKKEKPVAAVLIDRSASMSLVDKKGDRAQALQNILQSPLIQKDSDEYEKVIFPFSSELFEGSWTPPDSLILNGDGTDIRAALEGLKARLSEKYFSAVILITDGANNLGENPARFAATYGVPIYPIAIGDASEQKDVLIANYVANEIAYAGAKMPVDVYIKSSGFPGKKITVNLFQGKKPLDSQMISLADNGLEQKVRFEFVPEKEGLFKYEIKLPQLEGELTQLNNSKSFYVKVLKSKARVLLIAGGPGADFLFLKRALSGDENVEVQTMVEKFNGRFYGNARLPVREQLLKFDCLILLDFPRRTSDRSNLNLIKNYLAQGKPALFMLGASTDFDKLWELKDYLPFSTKPLPGAERPVYVRILPQGVQHPILRLAEDEMEIREKWQELPPVFMNLKTVSLHPNTQSLTVVDLRRSAGSGKRQVPVFATRMSGRRKSLTILAYGIWRWDLLMRGVGKTNESYQLFLQNALRWLITTEDSKLVRVNSNKEIYRSGEEVKFQAQVYFEDYQPVDGAEVVVQLQGEKEIQELTLESIGEGRYDGRFQVLEGGDYQFTGTAHLQGRVLGRDSGKFSVEEFNLEYQNTRMSEELLKRIALESGGEFYTVSDFAELNGKLKFPEKYLTLKNEWEIWNKPLLLITCLVLLSAEWFIRKRKGML
ncbi:MAG: hypothetical protein ACE5HS_00575 [bacterium]